MKNQAFIIALIILLFIPSVTGVESKNLNGLTFQLNKWDTAEEIQTSSGGFSNFVVSQIVQADRIKENSRFLIFLYNITNNNKSPYTIHEADFGLTDSEGNSYESGSNEKTIPPGEAKLVELVFLIPDNSNKLTLFYRPPNGVAEELTTVEPASFGAIIGLLPYLGGALVCLLIGFFIYKRKQSGDQNQ